MTESNQETRCPFCGLEMDVVAGVKGDDGCRRTFYRCDTKECPLWINSVTLEDREIAEAWCFREMNHIRAEMTGKALDIAALIGSRALAIQEVKALERTLHASRHLFARVHSELMSHEIERSYRFFDELVLSEVDRLVEVDDKPDFHCSRCCGYYDTKDQLMNHGNCSPWYEAQI